MKLDELRALHRDAVQRMHDAAAAIEDAGDDADLDALEVSLDEAQAEVERCAKNISRIERATEARSATPLPELPAVRSATAKGELRSEPIFRPDQATGGFFENLAKQRKGDGMAAERLFRNNEQVVDSLPEIRSLSDAQKRAISQTATAGGEFIAPTWLLDQYAAKLRAGRAYLNALGTRPYDNAMGNSINVPSVTTGATTAVQSDNAAVSNTDQVTSSITAQVQTIAGQSKASYQLVQLSQVGMDSIILDDLSRDYTKRLDDFALNSTVTNAKGILQVSGTNAVTYTDASPTVPELYPFIFQGKSAIEKNVFAPVDFAVMHPSTWNFILSALDTTTRPLFLELDASAFNAGGQFDADMPQGLAGNIAGVPVVVDANVPVNLGAGTNQAPIALVSRLSHDVWEGVPTFAVADQTNISSLQYVFVLYGYAGQMHRQPAGASIVNGTGLIVQSGF